MTDNNGDCTTSASITVADDTRLRFRPYYNGTTLGVMAGFGWGGGVVYFTTDAALRRFITEAQAALARPAPGHDDGGVREAAE